MAGETHVDPVDARIQSVMDAAMLLDPHAAVGHLAAALVLGREPESVVETMTESAAVTPDRGCWKAAADHWGTE